MGSLLRLQGGEDSGAVAVALHIHAHPMQQGQPCLTERRVLRHDEVVAEFHAGAASAENGGTVFRVVNRAQVATAEVVGDDQDNVRGRWSRIRPGRGHWGSRKGPVEKQQGCLQ